MYVIKSKVMAKALIFSLICLIVGIKPAMSRRMAAEEVQIMKNILLQKMEDILIRPVGRNESSPVEVEVNVYVRSIREFDDVNMKYNTELTFRQFWYDKRLAFEGKGLRYLTLNQASNIWTPDTFFVNELEGHFHNILAPNVFVRIYPDGGVLYSIRISLTLSCPMNLKNFPLDNQECKIAFASYGYTSSDLVYVWKQENPVQMSKRIRMAKFSLTFHNTSTCESKTSTGTYSCLKIIFSLSREMGFYIQNVYMPTMTLVILSWVPFWINEQCTTLRIGVSLGVILAMFIETSSISASNPSVSYTKAIDVWTGTCLTFGLCVLLMLCVISNTLVDNEKLDSKDELILEDATTEKILCDGDKTNGGIQILTYKPRVWWSNYPTKSKRINVVCRFFFPAVFAFFNLVYWFSYTS